MSSILSHIKFPLRVRHATGHVFIQDAEGTPRSSVAYAENIPRSYEYAVFICTTLARAMTDLHDGKAPAKVDPPAPPDDLTFKVELWFDDESAVQATLARTAKITHAKQLVMAIKAEYAGRNLKIRQGIRVIWESGQSDGV